jgi:phage shock protein C
MAVFCHQCGTALPPIARFCSGCGAGVSLNPGTQPIPSRPLIRPRIGRQIAGVCLGLSQANGWDVAVVRVVTVLGFIFSGGFVGIAYLAGWIGIPDEPFPLPGGYPPGSGAYPPGI